jgi:hypothetical protein
MAFASEADRLAYEAEIAAHQVKIQKFHAQLKKQRSRDEAKGIVRSDADRLMDYHDSNTVAGGGVAMILLGIPCLLIPPVGLAMITAGLASLGWGTKLDMDARAK